MLLVFTNAGGNPQSKHDWIDYPAIEETEDRKGPKQRVVAMMSAFIRSKVEPGWQILDGKEGDSCLQRPKPVPASNERPPSIKEVPTVV